MKFNEEAFDLGKNKRSFMPNYIQFLDSIIALQVISFCKASNVPILVNHDCFFTTLENDFFLLQTYNHIFYNVIFNSDNL
jgi:hypothetical protein